MPKLPELDTKYIFSSIKLLNFVIIAKNLIHLQAAMPYFTITYSRNG